MDLFQRLQWEVWGYGLSLTTRNRPKGRFMVLLGSALLIEKAFSSLIITGERRITGRFPALTTSTLSRNYSKPTQTQNCLNFNIKYILDFELYNPQLPRK